MRVFAVSDIHVDYRENRQWLSDISAVDYRQDILILAGDLTDDLRLLEQCFCELAVKFMKVLFVPGNHELWVLRDKTSDSMQKLRRIRAVAASHGIAMQPFHAGAVSIVPLLSWYDFSFARPDEQLQQGWMDFRACIWPDGQQPADVNASFLDSNRIHLQTTNQTLISFSHFLPRIDLIPHFIPRKYEYLNPVMGSVLLEKQVRALKSDIHVYGHSHVNNKVVFDGIQYINNAFGYPSEGGISSKQLLCIHQSQA